MPEPVPDREDSLETAVTRFEEASPSLEESLAGVEPLASVEQLDIADLTADERTAFAAALAEP
jgi:hypothetical protein